MPVPCMAFFDRMHVTVILTNTYHNNICVCLFMNAGCTTPLKLYDQCGGQGNCNGAKCGDQVSCMIAGLLRLASAKGMTQGSVLAAWYHVVHKCAESSFNDSVSPAGHACWCSSSSHT
jgi:hypothetical protein